MIKLITALKGFLHNEQGATAIEYAILLGLLALALIASITTMSTSLSDAFDDASQGLEDAN